MSDSARYDSDPLFDRYRQASMVHLAMKSRRGPAREGLATTDEELAAMDQAELDFAAAVMELGAARAAYFSQPQPPPL